MRLRVCWHRKLLLRRPPSFDLRVRFSWGTLVFALVR